MAAPRDVMVKLFLADRDCRDAPGAPWERFFQALTRDEAGQPLAVWIARKRDALDWDENVCDMVSRYFGIPQKPLWEAERENGYEGAAAALERALRPGVPPQPAA